MALMPQAAINVSSFANIDRVTRVFATFPKLKMNRAQKTSEMALKRLKSGRKVVRSLFSDENSVVRISVSKMKLRSGRKVGQNDDCLSVEDSPNPPITSHQQETELYEDGGSVAVRKRQLIASPDSWRQNVRKRRRNEGRKYISTTGKIVAARSIKNLQTDCPCPMKCSMKISVEHRKELFQSFWAMSSLQRQRDYLLTVVKSVAVGRKRAKTSTKRNVTMQYSFTCNGTSHRVCKRFFLTTLDISCQMVKTTLEKIHRSSTTMPSPDKRGRHTPSTKFPHHVTQFAKDHIDMFPRGPSPWCRADSTKEYLEANISKSEMYALYKDHCRTNGDPDIKVVSKSYYSKLLIEKNIASHVQKNMCWCRIYEELPEDEKAERAEEYALHVAVEN